MEAVSCSVLHRNDEIDSIAVYPRGRVRVGSRQVRLSVAAIVAQLLAASCGASRPQTIVPPQLTVIVGKQQIDTVLNGYQWSAPGLTSVADAANRPAANLPTHHAPAGAAAKVQFPGKQDALDLSEWRNGVYVGQTPLTGITFNLPKQPANYAFEVTVHWGTSYANYDFDVDTR